MRWSAAAAIVGGLLWIASGMWATVEEAVFSPAASARLHWLNEHVLVGTPDPFLAFAVFGLYLFQPKRFHWYGKAAVLLSILGFGAGSLTSLLILLSRGGGDLYDFAHSAEWVFAIAFPGLLLFYVDSLKANLLPRRALWLVLLGAPLVFVLGLIVFMLGGGDVLLLLSSLLAYSLLGLSFIWLGRAVWARQRPLPAGGFE